MSWGKIFICLLLGGGMAYAGYLIDLPRILYIATGAGIFITTMSSGMK